MFFLYFTTLKQFEKGIKMHSKETIIVRVNFAIGPILDGAWAYKCSFK